jgi:hypothetical protein
MYVIKQIVVGCKDYYPNKIDLIRPKSGGQKRADQPKAN